MKNIIVLLFLTYCFVGHSQIIDFPDPNFKNALVNTKCVDTDGDGVGDEDADINDDGEIELSEASNLINLDIRGKNIQSFEGIQNFNNLNRLRASNNDLNSLNYLPESIGTLEVGSCNIKTLYLSKLRNLNYLYAPNNLFDSLDISKSQNVISCFICNNPNLNYINIQTLKLDTIVCDPDRFCIYGCPNIKQICCTSEQVDCLLSDAYKPWAPINLENVIDTSCVEHVQFINFPDPNFKNALVNSKCVDLDGDGECDSDADINNDGEIDEGEAVKVFNLRISGYPITDVNGLRYFKNLEILICNGTQISSLSVNELKSLKLLDCSNNQIASLSIVNLPKLNYLNCFGNKIKTFETFNLPLLEGIFCSLNQIESIDITTLPKLVSLDISGGNKDLKLILAKNGNKDLKIEFPNNSKLSYVCADEFNIDKFNFYLNLNGTKNCEVNSYCSFTPGGKFYTIQGKIIYDGNINGCDDQDIKATNIKYNINNGSVTGSFISNSTGSYSIPVQEDTHTITPVLENPDHFEVTPSTITFTFPSTSDTITQDFCITPKGIFRQTNITVIPLSPPARPGFDASYKIVWKNVGNQIESGTLNFTYNEQLLYYIMATQIADQVADGNVKWNFSNLLPFEKREITVTLKVNGPTDTPAVNVGDKLYLTASFLDNIFTLENTVVGSYDPNDKTCLQGDRLHPDMIGKYVDFLIRFENTGNYAAENVVVKDIIDTKTFEVSTLQITDASHEVYTRIEGSKVEFIFKNIQLPFDDANNDGYIAFKIKTLPSMSIGDSLKNLADIYFDYNFPIRTNEAQTTIALPSFTKDFNTEVNIYPNPVRDILYIEPDENWNKAEIYDIYGRIIWSFNLNGQSIDVSGLENGTYLVRLKDGEKEGVVKFVKL